MLHLENRTQFPNIQEAAGAFNAKRAYLPAILAERLGIRGGWLSVTHALVGLWSSEVLHAARLRRSTMTALCPDGVEAFSEWWSGDLPQPGVRSTFVLLDPVDGIGRRRRYVGLDAVERIDPRYRDYGEAARQLMSASRSGDRDRG